MVKGPKEKKERALGEHLGVKAHRCQGPKCALVRKPYRPGAHGQKRQRNQLSDFGRQIREKQKFKITYGLNEHNLRELFNNAQTKSGSVAQKLMSLMEGRIDNVVFRMGLANSRSIARQLVVHGHIVVNKKRVRSPGYQVKEGDVVGVRAESMTKAAFKEVAEYLKKYEMPAWLHVDAGKLEGKVLKLPHETDVPFEINLLVESFSR